MPREGALVIDDLVRGQVEFQWAREQDHVIQRTDGSCLYHLANVVDDQDFQISHVIRAEEHLSNTPRQIFIAQGLGYPLPQYAHLPYVAEPGSRNKLSKRKLDKYLKNRDFADLMDRGRTIAQALGHVARPEQLQPGDRRFLRADRLSARRDPQLLGAAGLVAGRQAGGFSRDEMIENFSLERVNKAPASFDPEETLAFQDRYMQRLPLDEKLRHDAALPGAGRAGAPRPRPRIRERGRPAACGRPTIASRWPATCSTTRNSSWPTISFPTTRKRPTNGCASRKSPNCWPGCGSGSPRPARSSRPRWRPWSIEFAESSGVKIGEIVHPVAGGSHRQGGGLWIVRYPGDSGKDRCLARIDRALGWLKVQGGLPQKQNRLMLQHNVSASVMLKHNLRMPLTLSPGWFSKMEIVR